MTRFHRSRTDEVSARSTATDGGCPPALDDTLEIWLEGQVRRNLDWFATRPLLLDVGAYHGSFARQFLDLRPALFRQAVLFEPNPENFARLREAFGADARVRVEQLGCDREPGTREFFCCGQAYTGSLLPYVHQKSEAPGQCLSVQLVTLDNYFSAAGLSQRVGLLKIDTQGNDLRVLQGAAQMLRESRPWVVSELIYAPLYVGQASPAAIAACLSEFDYVCVGQFNEYYSTEGWLGWADGCFVPRECVRTDGVRYVKRPTAARALRKYRGWIRLMRWFRGR
jgi:FkbM family methyltransferase